MKLFLPNGAIHAVPEPAPQEPPAQPAEAVPYDYKEEAAQEAAECWKDETMVGIPPDLRLAKVFAKHLADWMQIAARAYRGVEFYRGIIDQCGKTIGVEAYASDDGSVQQDVLALKLPELVKHLIPESERALRLASVPVQEDKPAEEELS